MGMILEIFVDFDVIFLFCFVFDISGVVVLLCESGVCNVIMGVLVWCLFYFNLVEECFDGSVGFVKVVYFLIMCW